MKKFLKNPDQTNAPDKSHSEKKLSSRKRKLLKESMKPKDTAAQPKYLKPKKKGKPLSKIDNPNI